VGNNFYRPAWLPAVGKVGLTGVHFHDLRHTGNTLTADADANLRELMERMGHSSTRAALVYLHSTSDRQRSIADAVGNAAKAALSKPKTPATSEDGATPSGTKVARRRSKAS
jgi:integrase